MTFALTKKAQEQFGDDLRALGYELVDIVYTEDEDGDKMPHIENPSSDDGKVDCFYFTWYDMIRYNIYTCDQFQS